MAARYRALVVTTAAVLAAGAVTAAPQAAAASLTTAWHNGTFSENTGGVVSRSDVVLGKPNSADTQSLPLGNGSLGVAAWAANGFTAQLNRSDTMPYRLSPGQVRIPGLSAMTSASNFTGTLDLYNGVLTESGGGMALRAWVPAGKDELVVDVTGANPAARQTATLNLWSGRSPATAASGAIASLAQTWVDNSQSGASGQTFGAMAAITAGGRNVTTSVVNSEQVQVAFTPNADGSFRVVVASPSWTGGNPATTAASVIGTDTTAATASLLSTQAAAWNDYWAHAGLVEMNSADGTAQYLENLRTIYLYAEAASMRAGRYPGSQAGVADMFAFDQDKQDWYPAGYWLWNLRGQLAANLSSGNAALNVPIFDMYLNDLPAIKSWTGAQMGGKPGACVPETMRFNGNGFYNGGSNTQNASCALASSPSYNAETITSGAEIAQWIWRQYQTTGGLDFLRKYYPVLAQAATFLLAYQNVGSDGFLHAVANAHETQWAVKDPTTDLAADQALFAATISAATLLNTDSSLVAQLRAALSKIEPYARTDAATHSQLLPPSADAQGTDVIANSFEPAAQLHNGENLGLEPVWPYGVITDGSGGLTALAQRTYDARPNKNSPDWSFDAVQAARLDLRDQVAADLTTNTQHYQAYISGIASLSGSTPGDEPYIEQSSTVATALDEALATDYDGTLRFAPAWPSGWDVAGTVAIQGNSTVDVQVEGGTLATAAIHAGTTRTLSVRNPWPGKQAEVVNGVTGAVVVAPTTAATLSVPVTAGSSYLVEQASSPTTSLPFAQVTGTKASRAKHLGTVQIGLDPVSTPAAVSWTGTWAASSEASGPSFQQQTLRQIVHTSIGGSSARVQISNAFGSQPLPLADVHVARRSAGSAITAGTDRSVTFAGKTALTIPAGGLAVSDPIPFTVPALSDVAVSMYLPSATGPSTQHAQGTATNYVAPGDVTTSTSLAGAHTTGSYYFLADLDVTNPAAQGAVVTLGASITDGVASAPDANRRWPNDLAARLAKSGRTIAVLNQGISGNRLLVDGSGPSALRRFSRDVLAQAGAKWVIFSDDPINDLGSTTPPPTPDQLIAGVQQLISRAHQAGLKFLCSTLTPYQGASYWTPQGESARESFNTFVRPGNGCDGIVDQDQATHDPASPTRYLPSYDSGDHLHPNESGLQAIANAVNLSLFGPASPAH